jgi:23S rRNA (uracil1939-C5)-methyltransferase
VKPRRTQHAPKKLRAADAPLRLVQIEKPIYGGAFLARDEGKAVFVPLALPGENVRVRLVEEKRAYAAAELEEIVTSAPERVTPGCRHFGPCGGCHYQHADYDAQLRFKQAVLRETLERGGVTPPAEIEVLAGQPWAYRNRIRLAFDAAGNPGYRGRRSHALVNIAECPIAAPLLVRAASIIAGHVRRLAPSVRPSEIALFCDAEESKLLVMLFTRNSTASNLADLAVTLQKEVPQLVRLELVLEGGANQPERTIAQYGSTSMTYSAAGYPYRVDHGAFFQVNRWLVDALVDRVTTGHTGKTAWDLFAGVGLFARRLATTFQSVMAIESAPAATDALQANLYGTNGEAVCASSLDFLRRQRETQRPDLVVVDPPRTGLGPDMTTRLAEIGPPSLVYVSCDPATLARDLRALLATGYLLESVTLVDLFPQTFHLETVARLRRA